MLPVRHPAVVWYASLLSILSAPGAAFAGPGAAPSADDLWVLIDSISADRAAGVPWVRPDRYQAVLLDADGMRNFLAGAPLEAVTPLRASPFIISLPMPDGSFARFQAVESPVMAPELARQYPEIRTYLGQGIDDPHASVRFDMTPAGFHAQIISPNGWVYIDPYTQWDTALYTSYYKQDLQPRNDFVCLGAIEAGHLADDLAPAGGTRALGDTRREYALACAATGEYTAFHGGTVALGLAAVNTSVNRVVGVYEIDMAVRLILVANNNLIIYTDGTTDPYSNSDGFTMLSQNQSNLNAVIGNANYDIGHVFSTGGGGIAALGSACSNFIKAQGVTGLTTPINDPFDIDYVAHEMGHQFNATHTFNSCGDNSQRTSSTAYEPGSGSTIMSYAGICGPANNLQSHSDAYFHFASLNQINQFIEIGTGSVCDTPVATGNNPPVVNAGIDYTIPSGTPFMLTAGSASDPNGDSITYCWEERDLGPAQNAAGAGSADNGSSPLFRSRTPTASPSRTFPAPNLLLLNNYNAAGERLPTTNRSLNFRLTVRDNRAGAGGTAQDDMLVTVTNAGGAFSVTFPSASGLSLSGNITVTWNVANTNLAPVNTANVAILLSTNGGNSFDTTLLASTPNDGSQVVTLPNINTTQARIKVAAVGNIFFEISNSNFTITPAAPAAPGSASASPAAICAGASSDLSAVVGGGLLVDWYTASCGGTLVGTGNPLSVSPVTTTTYYARARDPGTGLSSATCATTAVALYTAGDANADGFVNELDADPFANILLNAPSAIDCGADMDGDLDADADDLHLFVDALVP
jgi:hypothetical protein